MNDDPARFLTAWERDDHERGKRGEPPLGPRLFDKLAEFPPALPDDELRLLATLPDWETVAEISHEDEAAVRRLEKRGLVKVHRWKDDPIAIRPTLYAGRLPAARLR